MMTASKIADRINRVMECLGMVVLVVLVIATSLQVFTRYVLNSSLSWTDELSRYCFIWASMIGAAVAAYKGTHAAVDVLVQNFTGKVKTVHKTIVYLIVIYVCIVLTIEGFQAVKMVGMQRSTAMHIPMSYVYASLPVNCIIIVVQSALSIIGLYDKK